MCISDYIQILSSTLEDSRRNYHSDNQYSSITKDSVHHIKHMYLQHSYMEVD